MAGEQYVENEHKYMVRALVNRKTNCSNIKGISSLIMLLSGMPTNLFY